MPRRSRCPIPTSDRVRRGTRPNPEMADFVAVDDHIEQDVTVRRPTVGKCCCLLLHGRARRCGLTDAARDEIGNVDGASAIEPPPDRRLGHGPDVDMHTRMDSLTWQAGRSGATGCLARQGSDDCDGVPTEVQTDDEFSRSAGVSLTTSWRRLPSEVRSVNRDSGSCVEPSRKTVTRLAERVGSTPSCGGDPVPASGLAPLHDAERRSVGCQRAAPAMNVATM